MDRRLCLTVIWIVSSAASDEIQQNLYNSDETDTWHFKDILSFLRPIFGVLTVDENSDSLWISGKYNTWIFSLLASCVIGTSGILPLFVISADCGTSLQQDRGTKTLRLLLSFAVGGLLGDVFLHLLPEAWKYLEETDADSHAAHLTQGLWILLGILTFIVIEMMCVSSQLEKKKEDMTSGENQNSWHSSESSPHISAKSSVLCHKTTNCDASNGCVNMPLKHSIQYQNKPSPCLQHEPIQVAGYLNLMANSIDNFTHGLAVSASFLVGTKVGILTTFAILMHEIPHEVGDFAILLRSGFSRWEAAKAQLSTAGVGILGAVVALSVDSTDSLGKSTAWILPFTSGGFLNIALVNVLPEIMKEEDPWESLKQIGYLCSGIAVMGLVSAVTA